MENLTANILKELAYFDILDYPLSLMDLQRRLEDLASMSEVLGSLDLLLQSGKIETKDSFYFLAGREDLVQKRISRYALSKGKLKKAIFTANVLAHFPYVKGVAIYSSLSYLNAQPEGDLDFFMIAEKGRLWSARFWVNLVLKIFNLRPNEKTSKDKICVSFWVDESEMSLVGILKGDDSHYLYSHSQFIFLAGASGIREKFFKANDHLSDQFSNWQFYYFIKFKIISSGIKNFIENSMDLIAEKRFRNFQKKIMPQKFKDLDGLDGRVIIGERMLKMHYSDKRDWANEQLAIKLKTLNEEN